MYKSLIIGVLCANIWLLPVTTVNGQTECDNLNWDANLVRELNSINSPGLRTASSITSDALLPLTIGTPLLLYAYGAIPIKIFDDAQQNYRYAAESGLQMGVTMLFAYGITGVLKEVVGRERPYQAYPDCITGYGSSTDGSWPSGHSTGSAALATTLCLRYPQWYVIAPSVLYALYTGFARMNLGMHYLTDVLSGYAVGVGVALLVNAFNEELFDFAEGILPDKGLVSTSVGMNMNVISFSISL